LSGAEIVGLGTRRRHSYIQGVRKGGKRLTPERTASCLFRVARKTTDRQWNDGIENDFENVRGTGMGDDVWERAAGWASTRKMDNGTETETRERHTKKRTEETRMVERATRDIDRRAYAKIVARNGGGWERVRWSKEAREARAW
jgi:hypothetical protein